MGKSGPLLRAEKLLAGLCLLLLLGCRHERTLLGSWDLYSPFNQEPGTMTFDSNTFKSVIPAGGWLKSPVKQSGVYTLNGTEISR